MAEQLQYDILNRISETNAKGVLIDISALEMVDSFIGRTLADTARMASTLNAEIVIVGMRPAVAITLVELGLALTGVRTALNLDDGYELLKQLLVDNQADITEEVDEDSDSSINSEGSDDSGSDQGRS